jgi:hypothetical protein
MAHWAEIDENKLVTRVLVGSNDDLDEGYQWLIDNLGGNWIKTSYNGNIRKNFAGIGYAYDSTRDAFIPPMPSTTVTDLEIEGGTKEVTWTLNEDTCNWEITA